MKKKRYLFYVVLSIWSISSFAQIEPTICVVKNDSVIFSSSIYGIDNVIFDGTTSNDALFVHVKYHSLPDEIQLNNIKQLTFLGENLLVEMLNGIKQAYSFEEIEKLAFKIGNIETGDNTVVIGNKVHVYFTPTGHLKVESQIPINSLTLFSIDGKILYKKHCKSVETHSEIPLHGKVAGGYIVHIETGQGVIAKKIVKH